MQIKSVLTIALSLYATGYAMPMEAAQNETESAFSNAVGPDSTQIVGFHTLPYSATYCGGNPQGNTNVNRGTSACINLSNAKSLKYTSYNTCNHIVVKWHGLLNCGDPPYATDNINPLGGFCQNLIGTHRSARVYCFGDFK